MLVGVYYVQYLGRQLLDRLKRVSTLRLILDLVLIRFLHCIHNALLCCVYCHTYVPAIHGMLNGETKQEPANLRNVSVRSKMGRS